MAMKTPLPRKEKAFNETRRMHSDIESQKQSRNASGALIGQRESLAPPGHNLPVFCAS